jgi:hypothetical protein
LTRRDLLEALLAVTPPPPDGEPDEVLVAFDEMTRARTAPLLALAEARGAVAPDETAVVDELARRHNAWADALERARRTTGDRLVAVRRMRRAEETLTP